MDDSQEHNDFIQGLQDDVEFQPLKDFLEQLKEGENDDANR